MSTATATPKGVIGPVEREKAATEVQPILDQLNKTIGYVPGFFGTMARVPEALQHFLPLYAAVITKGNVEPKYKELAYLKTALTNGCQYCYRAHAASGKKNGVTDEQIKDLAFFMRSSAYDAKEKATILYAERLTRG